MLKYNQNMEHLKRKTREKTLDFLKNFLTDSLKKFDAVDPKYT